MRDLLVSYYGDDFTGSTDVMEALASNGIPTVLFLGIPDQALLDRFQDCRAIGIAGTSRSESPAWMQEHLAPAFQWLKGLQASICHYKVCSTFDSSPAIGSIGRVMDLSRSAFGDTAIPIVAATPALGRYCAFGNLFARSATDGRVHRIDRHPIMSVHPVTPMHEADLARHLGAQTSMPMAA